MPKSSQTDSKGIDESVSAKSSHCTGWGRPNTMSQNANAKPTPQPTRHARPTHHQAPWDTKMCRCSCVHTQPATFQRTCRHPNVPKVSAWTDLMPRPHAHPTCCERYCAARSPQQPPSAALPQPLHVEVWRCHLSPRHRARKEAGFRLQSGPRRALGVT